MTNEHRTNSRVDIATTIHKAVRKVLFDHSMLLARTDFRSVDGARAAHGSLLSTLSALREHAHHEDVVILPEVARTNPPLAAEAIRQHDPPATRARDRVGAPGW